jgi:O-antigen/teichoic acid export membrane protein
MSIAGGPKYADYWPLLTIMCLSYIFYAISATQMTIIGLFGKGTEALLRDGVAGTIGLVSTFLLIFFLGEYGMAWGQLVSFFALYLVGYKITKKYIIEKKPVTRP